MQQSAAKKSNAVRVLVCDDSSTDRKITKKVLESQDWIETVEAPSAKDALNILERDSSIDLIISDIMMPDMDGIETFRRLRKKNGFYFKEVPVIALTANTVFGAREMFLEEGFQDFLPKPIEISALKRVLKTYIPDEKIIMENHHRFP